MSRAVDWYMIDISLHRKQMTLLEWKYIVHEIQIHLQDAVANRFDSCKVLSMSASCWPLTQQCTTNRLSFLPIAATARGHCDVSNWFWPNYHISPTWMSLKYGTSHAPDVGTKVWLVSSGHLPENRPNPGSILKIYMLQTSTHTLIHLDDLSNKTHSRLIDKIIKNWYGRFMTFVLTLPIDPQLVQDFVHQT